MEIKYLADEQRFVDALAQWHYDEWSRMREWDSVSLPRETLIKRANRRAIPTVFIALQDGLLFGSATLAESDLETRRDLTPWLTDVYVAPEFRRRGVASALVRRVVEEAAALNVPELYLWTTGKMREDLYAGLGWTTFDRPFYRGTQRVLMSIRPAR